MRLTKRDQRTYDLYIRMPRDLRAQYLTRSFRVSPSDGTPLAGQGGSTSNHRIGAALWAAWSLEGGADERVGHRVRDILDEVLAENLRAGGADERVGGVE